MNTTRLARRIVHGYVNKLDRRGRARDDGRVTLLTVNYQGRPDTERLLTSWRRFVDAPAVVVENTGAPKRYPHARTVGVGANLHHGLGLDFGLRFVTTEYVVIADPDSIVTSPDFWPTLRPLVNQYGAASIDIGSTFYHPMCLAFRAELWKRGGFTMQPDWSRGWDVAAALTDALGGMRDEANLPRTAGVGDPLPSSRPGKSHHVAEVYGDVFSNTVGASRITIGANEFGAEEWDLDVFRSVHERWRAWADDVVAGRATTADFTDAVSVLTS